MIFQRVGFQRLKGRHFGETSSVKLCRYCALEMDKTALVCPHCRRHRKTGAFVAPGQPIEPVRPREAWRFWGWVVILLVVAYFAYCYVMVQRVMH